MSEIVCPEAILFTGFLALNMQNLSRCSCSLRLSKIAMNVGKLVDLRSTEAYNEHEKQLALFKISLSLQSGAIF